MAFRQYVIVAVLEAGFGLTARGRNELLKLAARGNNQVSNPSPIVVKSAVDIRSFGLPRDRATGPKRNRHLAGPGALSLIGRNTGLDAVANALQSSFPG